MGCRILHDRDGDMATLYCSTSDWAFGPVFQADDEHDADERAEAFCEWLKTAPKWRDYEKTISFGVPDPRELTEAGMQAAYSDFLADEANYWKRQEEALL